jgi:hypothetical protein
MSVFLKVIKLFRKIECISRLSGDLISKFSRGPVPEPP